MSRKLVKRVRRQQKRADVVLGTLARVKKRKERRRAKFRNRAKEQEWQQ